MSTGSMQPSTLVEELQSTNSPQKRRTSLISGAGSFNVTLMKCAVDDAGRSPDQPGNVDQYWFEDEQMVVIDLSNDE